MSQGVQLAEGGAPIWMIQGTVAVLPCDWLRAGADLAGKLVNCLRRPDANNFRRRLPFVVDKKRPIYQKYLKFYDAYFDRNGGIKSSAADYDGIKFTLFYQDSRPPIDRNLLAAHFHRHTYGLLAMLEYAMAVHDEKLIDYVHKGFLYARAKRVRLGRLFSECIWPMYPTSETCEVADMIDLAMMLSETGCGDYWDDADRWLRTSLPKTN